MTDIKPRMDDDGVPRCTELCSFRQSATDDEGDHQWWWCGKTGIALPESDVCIPGYRALSQAQAEKVRRSEAERDWMAGHLAEAINRSDLAWPHLDEYSPNATAEKVLVACRAALDADTDEGTTGESEEPHDFRCAFRQKRGPCDCGFKTLRAVQAAKEKQDE